MSYSIVRRRRRPNASLLAEAVRTIGKRRFEIRQQVSCPLEDRKLHYLVETWFFFPQSLQINRWSYTATDYQQSLKNYIRLGVPIRPLESLLGGELPPVLRKLEAEEGGGEEIIDLTLPEQVPDILEGCSRLLDDLLWQNTPEIRERYEDSLKLFCIAFRVSLLARKNAVLAIEDGNERTRAAYNLTRLAVACLKRYRKLLGRRAKEAQNLLRAPAFLYCDEYLSIITTRTLGEIVRRLSPVHKCSTYILACFGAQRAYRRYRYPESMPTKTGDNELPVFRWGVLKKYVDMPLFQCADLRDCRLRLHLPRAHQGCAQAQAVQGVRQMDPRSGAARLRRLWQASGALRRAVPVRGLGQAPQGRARPAEQDAFRGHPECIPQ